MTPWNSGARWEGARWITVLLFAAAMAWMEAATATYLRLLVGRVQPYQPDPLPLVGGLGWVEGIREAATLAEQLELPGERWAIAAALGELYDAWGLPEQARQSFACAAAIVQALASVLADEVMRATFLAAEPVRRVLARRR